MPEPKPSLCRAAWHQLRAQGPLCGAKKLDNDRPMSHVMPPYPSPSLRAVPWLFAQKPQGKVTQLLQAAPKRSTRILQLPGEDASAPFGALLVSKQGPRALQLDLLPHRELTELLSATQGTL